MIERILTAYSSGIAEKASKLAETTRSRGNHWWSSYDHGSMTIYVSSVYILYLS